jgi:hypothetical protein
MTVPRNTKLHRLDRDLPEGLLVDAAWMERQGYSRSLRSQYVASGWLEQPVRGTYRRPRGALRWEQVVISLQALLHLPVSVGGRTALDLQGYAHYLRQSNPIIHLYSDTRLPAWVSKLPLDDRFKFHNRQRFMPESGSAQERHALSLDSAAPPDRILPRALHVIPWGSWNWPLVISTPERAVLELIDELPAHETFHDVDVTMEGLANLSPRRLQTLLEQTSSVKVKRLFFFFADRHRHSWRAHIDRDKVNLGKGKRVIVKGGRLDPEYLITVPEGIRGVP